MRLIKKIGLSLLLFGFYGTLSYGLSPVPPQSGACSFQPRPATGKTVCKKGIKKVTYKITTQNLNMTYQHDLRMNQQNRQARSDEVGSGIDLPVRPAGYCHQEGFTINFCKLYEHKGSTTGDSVNPSTRLLTSHYDKWDRTVCYGEGGSTSTGIGRTQSNKCKDVLAVEIAKKKKRGWKCKYSDLVQPPAPIPVPPAIPNSPSTGSR